MTAYETARAQALKELNINLTLSEEKILARIMKWVYNRGFADAVNTLEGE